MIRDSVKQILKKWNSIHITKNIKQFLLSDLAILACNYTKRLILSPLWIGIYLAKLFYFIFVCVVYLFQIYCHNDILTGMLQIPLNTIALIFYQLYSKRSKTKNTLIQRQVCHFTFTWKNKTKQTKIFANLIDKKLTLKLIIICFRSSH